MYDNQATVSHSTNAIQGGQIGYANGGDVRAPEPMNISAAIKNIAEKAEPLAHIEQAISGILDFLRGPSPQSAEGKNSPCNPMQPVSQLNLIATFLGTKTNHINAMIEEINRLLGR